MSSTLTWKPKLQQPESRSLPDDLKFILREYNLIPNAFTQADIPYLNGLAHAKIDGAKELIELIEKFQQVDVQEEY